MHRIGASLSAPSLRGGRGSLRTRLKVSGRAGSATTGMHALARFGRYPAITQELPMRSLTPIAFALAFGLSGLSILVIPGCGDQQSPGTSSASSSQPVSSPSVSSPSADDVRADAKRQRDAINRDYAVKFSEMKLRLQQDKDAAAQKGAQADLDRDKEVAQLEITMQGIVDSIKQEKDAVDADAVQKLKDPGSQEVAIKADQKRRKEDIELRGSNKMNTVTVKIDHAKAVDLEKHQEIDRTLTAQLKDEQQKILAEENASRRRAIDVDYEATVKLDAIKHTVAAQNEQLRQEQLRRLEKDMKISQSIRDGLASDTSVAVPSRNVDVATTDGVVEISGTVPSESDHRAIIAVATRADGVQRVNDRLAVR
jgi:osmotically-inducible protein OsmY